MAQQLTLQDAKESLTAHIASKATDIREKYGPAFGWRELQLVLEDRECTRFPCTLVFDAAPLKDGEFAHPVQLGETPEAGYRMCVHPFFSTEPNVVPALVLYQLVLVNYGDFASPSDAEVFGSIILGIPQEEYYDLLCEMADMVSSGISTANPATLSQQGGGGSCGSSCGCH